MKRRSDHPAFVPAGSAICGAPPAGTKAGNYTTLVDATRTATADGDEVGPDNILKLWSRGGFPESYLARNDADSLAWRNDFIRTYLERDIPQLVPRFS